MALTDAITRMITDHHRVIGAMLSDPGLIGEIERAALMIADCIRAGGAVLVFGNGGSAADAQHISAELVGRFAMERKGLRVIALAADTPVMTSLTNDYGYEEVFARQIDALGRPGDIALALSTSGNSPNVLRAIDAARRTGLRVIGLSGKDGGGMRDRCDHLIIVPSNDTPRIQEAHTLVYHIICGLVEEEVCGG